MGSTKKSKLFLLLMLFALAATFSKNGMSQDSFCSCADYARYATGIQIFADGKDWDNEAFSAGYSVSSVPVLGGAMNFEAGAHGADDQWGHVARVVSYELTQNHWRVLVRHANWGGTDSHLSCNNVGYTEFDIPLGDHSVHFIY